MNVKTSPVIVQSLQNVYGDSRPEPRDPDKVKRKHHRKMERDKKDRDLDTDRFLKDLRLIAIQESIDDERTRREEREKRKATMWEADIAARLEQQHEQRLEQLEKLKEKHMQKVDAIKDEKRVSDLRRQQIRANREQAHLRVAATRRQRQKQKVFHELRQEQERQRRREQWRELQKQEQEQMEKKRMDKTYRRKENRARYLAKNPDMQELAIAEELEKAADGGSPVDPVDALTTGQPTVGNDTEQSSPREAQYGSPFCYPPKKRFTPWRKSEGANNRVLSDTLLERFARRREQNNKEAEKDYEQLQKKVTSSRPNYRAAETFTEEVTRLKQTSRLAQNPEVRQKANRQLQQLKFHILEENPQLFHQMFPAKIKPDMTPLKDRVRPAPLHWMI